MQAVHLGNGNPDFDCISLHPDHFIQLWVPQYQEYIATLERSEKRALQLIQYLEELMGQY